MRNLKLVIAYDGTDFFGWQRQPGLRTVEGALEEAIGRLTGAFPQVHASGRTDAGVHALGQVCHFHLASDLPAATIARALNALGPPDLRVLSVEDVPESFHCTLDARSKRYRYAIDNGRLADPFGRRYSWAIPYRLDHEAMNRSARDLLGRHDFRSFETNWPNRTSSVRTIFDIEVTRSGDRVEVEVEADGFLYNMVRAITGTLVLIGSGRRPSTFAAEALRAEDRTRAGPNAPPQGLFLVRVHYGRDGPITSPGGPSR